MRARTAKPIIFGAFLLGTTALVSPALAQNVVNANALDAINNDNALATATFGQPQTISSGILNVIGASATGALAEASVNQTVSQSTVTQGSTVQPGNTVSVVGSISATNDTTVTPVAPATANIEADVTISGFALIGSAIGSNSGGGVGNFIGATATGAAAQATIIQSFDTNTATDLTTLAANAVDAANVPISATNTAGSVLATLVPGSFGEISDGIGNSISAQAAGASAIASIGSRQLDTTNATTAGSLTPSTNTVTTGDLSASNNGTVTATSFDGFQNATIDNGIGNSIGSLASGASGGAGVNQAVDFTVSGPTSTASLDALYSNTVTSGSITATNAATGTVYASIGDTTTMFSGSPLAPAIDNGIGNSISAQAVGAGAGNSITQAFENVTFGQLPTGFGPNPATNSVTTGSLIATNYADVTAFVGALGANIDDGIGNSIVASAVGASTSIGVTQSLYNDTFIDVPQLGTNTATTSSAVGMIATNGADLPLVPTPGPAMPVTATMDIYQSNAEISNGVGNTIGASAIGASTSASITQSILGSTGDLTLLGSNAVVVTNTGASFAMVATNTGTNDATPVIAAVNLTGGANALIDDGVGNAISAQAVGATASATITSRLDNTTVPLNLSSTVQTNSINTTGGGGTGGLLASNIGAVSASLMGSAPTGAATITTGVANTIGATAIGAGAADGINQSVAFDTLGATNDVVMLSLFGNSVATGALDAVNTGAVSSSITLPGNTVIGTLDTVLSLAGVGNTIAAQATGASSSASISSRFYNVTAEAPLLTLLPAATNTVTLTNMTAYNDGTVTAQANLGSAATTANINNGVGNFIGASAVGASASASIAQSVSWTVAAFPFDMSQLPSNTVQASVLLAINANTVAASIISPGTTEIGLVSSAPVSSGANNVGNSISAQAVGASASASITTQVFNTFLPTATTVTPATNVVALATLASTNGAPVSATGSFGTTGSALTTVSIGGGVGNTIGASATGASSLASINQVVSASSAALNTLPTNTITAGTLISAQNAAGGSITASITTLGSPFTTIAGGVGNSISANAVGASAGASIAQTIAGVR
jgi:trimeric autotransporter adhesin